jgi:hypothetical protein
MGDVARISPEAPIPILPPSRSASSGGLPSAKRGLHAAPRGGLGGKAVDIIVDGGQPVVL